MAAVALAVAYLGFTGSPPRLPARPHVAPPRLPPRPRAAPPVALQRPLETAEWDVRPRVALLGMAAVCGLNFPLLHITEAAIPPPEVTALRFVCALLPFLPLLAQRLSELGPTGDRTAAPGLEIGAWCALGYISQALGLAITSPTRGAFICALFMVVTPLANGFMGRRVPMQAWLSVGIALLGTACLEGVVQIPMLEAAAATADVGLNQGDLLCGGGALGFGVMFARMEAHMETLQPDDALPMTAWQLVSLALLTCAWFAQAAMGGGGEMLGLEGLESASVLEPLLIPSILFMGFVSGAGVLWGETVALRDVPSTEAGVIFATEPIWAAALAAYLLHEGITAPELIGGGLIVLACLTLQLPEEALMMSSGKAD